VQAENAWIAPLFTLGKAASYSSIRIESVDGVVIGAIGSGVMVEAARMMLVRSWKPTHQEVP